MLLEKIKAVLGEELATQVEAKLTEGKIELGITNDGTLVPAEKHDSMKAEHKATLEQLGNSQAQLKALEGSTGTVEELKAELQKQAQEFDQFKADTVKRETIQAKSQAISKALEKAGAIKSSIDLLATTFDLEKIQLDNSGNIVDLNDIINPVKEARKELFVAQQMGDNTPPKTDPPPTDESDPQAFFNNAMKKE